MIKSTNRLRATRHIKRAFEKGASWQGDFFRAKAFKRRGTQAKEPARLAVIVSKKFSSKAVERNLCRRRVRDAFRNNLLMLAGWDIAVLVSRACIEIKFEKLAEEAQICAKYLQSKQ